MGYLTTGFLFLAQPSFAAIADAFPGVQARGYRHKVRPIWALDLWEKPWRKQAKHFPFQQRFAASAVEPPPAGPDVSAFLGELDGLLAALGNKADVLVAKECRLALGISRLAAAPTFFFAGDDDLVDVACTTEAGRLARFRCRLGRLALVHDEGRSEILPSASLEEDDEEADQQRVIDVARTAVSWRVAPPAASDGGRQLHESALALWPSEAGEPGELLGVGTWDPVQNLDADFDVVFERA
jgi:hypothetical protein